MSEDKWKAIKIKFECHCNRVQVEQLQNNWNELKKWLETMLDSPKDFYSVIRVKDTLEKMQELENRKV